MDCRLPKPRLDFLDVCGSEDAGAGSHGGADPKILRAFFEYVAHGVRPAVSPIAARNAVAVGALGHYSARHGNVPMDIPPVPEHIRQFFGEA